MTSKVDLFYSYLCLDYVNLDMVQSWNQGSLRLRPMRTLACYLAIKDNSWLQDDSVDVVLGYLGVWESYKNAILGVANSLRPSGSTLAQKLLGFSSDSPKDNSRSFKVLEGSLIHQRLSRNSDDDEIEVSANEIDAIIREELPKRLYNLLDSFHTAALASPWTRPRRFSASPPTSTAHQGSSTIITSNNNFVPKLHVLCKILSMLDISDRDSFKRQKDHTIIDQQWLQRMFGIIRPATGEVGSLSALRVVPDSDDISTSLRDWLQRDWNQLRNAEASGSVTHLLLHFMMRSALHVELFEDDLSNVQLGPARNPAFNTHMMLPLQELFFKQSFDRLTRAVHFIE
jgi:hypothetical protein